MIVSWNWVWRQSVGIGQFGFVAVIVPSAGRGTGTWAWRSIGSNLGERVPPTIVGRACHWGSSLVGVTGEGDVGIVIAIAARKL